MKTVGMILVLVCCIAAGRFYSSLLIRRIRALEHTALLMEQIEMQMDFSLRPPSEIVLELKDRPEFASLTYLQECVRRMEGGASFPAAWRGAVEQERALGPMKREDTELLLSFGSGLGTTDLPGQKKLCEVHRKMTQQQIAAARQQYASKGRLATVLGTAAGAAAVILFI